MEDLSKVSIAELEREIQKRKRNNEATIYPQPQIVQVGYNNESHSCSRCGRSVRLVGTVYGIENLVCDYCAH